MRQTLCSAVTHRTLLLSAVFFISVLPTWSQGTQSPQGASNATMAEQLPQ